MMRNSASGVRATEVVVCVSLAGLIDGDSGGCSPFCSGNIGDVGVMTTRGPLVFSSGRRAIVRCPGRVSRIPFFAFCSASARACDTTG